MKKFLIKLAYRFLIKQSYDFLPYFYCGEIYEVDTAHSSYDVKNNKTILTIKAEREW
jgi:hypothetical protein